MAGGSEISNELTLDVSDFTQGLERATKKLDSFNTKLDSLDGKSEKLEKDFKDLSTNANQAAKSMGEIGNAGKSVDHTLSSLVKDAQKAQRAFENMGDWTSHYGKSLDSLRPKMEAITTSTRTLHSVTAKSTAEEAKAIQAGIESRARDLQDEQRVINERIRARQQMIAQLAQIERRAETSATYARADAYKINKDGQEVPRYRGKNISRQRELEAEIATYQKEAQVISQQKQHIAAIVGEMEYRNTEISKAIAGEKQLLQANEQQLAAQRAARQEAQKLAQEKKDQARQQAQAAKQLARETAEAEKQAAKDVLTAQRQAHKDLMVMKREEIQAQKEMVALATGVAVAGTTKAGVNQIADYQNTDTRVKAINLSAAEEERFRQKAWDMSAQEKYLSRTEAMQTRLDALTAIGYNKEPTIDKTVGSAARNAYILRSMGYETNDFSDVVKNLYGFAEARQVMDRPDEVNKSFDIARRIGVASGGKIKMADIETVARNIGDLRQTMSSEGWVRLAAVMEQFKTAGGGNGGGGGVASVGTIFKMMSLYASGKPLTNGAAMDLLGADVMNEGFKDGTGQNFKNTREANAAFVKAVKYAGFKNTESMSKDPVKFFVGIRGQLLDYMMQPSQFKKFFGADAQKHSYDKQGHMIGADGKQVEQRKQDDIENAAFKRFFARMGLSNKAIDGMLLTTNRSFAERSYHAADTAMNGKDEFQLMKDLSQNWKANMDALKASLVDFAITFDPLLRQLSSIPKGLADIIRGLSEFGTAHNGIASLAVAFLAFKIAVLATHGPLGTLAKLLLFNGGAQKSIGFLASISAALAGMMGSAKNAGSAVDGMAATTATASKKAGDALGGNVTAGATAATNGVKTGVGAIMRVLGTLINWAGWLTLAGMLGWAIGKWIADIQVGGITVNEHTQNLINSMVSNFKVGFQEIRMAWNWLITKIRDEQSTAVKDARAAMANITSNIAGIRQTQNSLHNRTDGDAKGDLARQYASHFDKIAKSNKPGSFVINGVKYTNISPSDARKNSERLKKYNANDIMPLTLPKSGWMGRVKGDAVSEMNQAVLDSIGGETLQKQVSRNKPKPAPKPAPVHTEPPTSRFPNQGAHVSDQTGHLAPAPKKPKTPKPKRGDFVPQNAYDASLAALKAENFMDNQRIIELMGQPVNYGALAQAAFTKEWMTGKLDDGRDPSKRKFAKRAYQKGVDWKESDINWSDPKVQEWMKVKAGNLKQDGTQKSLEFAAGKMGEASERFDDAVLDFKLDADANSSQVAQAKREFGKYEAKNPTATQKNAPYNELKLQTLSKLAGANYMAMAADLKKQNGELDDQFLENETQANRKAEKRRIDSETKKLKAVQDALDEQLNALIKNGNFEDVQYQKLLKAKQDGEKEFTTFLENQEKLRVKNTRSAYDQTMAQWRDLETNINSILANFGERAGTDIWDIINGDKNIDVRGYLGDMTKEVGGSLYKSAWGKASKFVMGEGQGTNVLDMLKNFAAGKEQSNDGWLGRFINNKSSGNGIFSKALGGARSILGKFLGKEGAEVKELTGDQATNANTSALQQLTAAIQQWAVGKGLLSTPLAQENGIGGAMPGGVIGFENVNAQDPMAGTGGYLNEILGTDGSPAGLNTGNFSYAFGDDTTGGKTLADGAENVGMFDSIKAGFSNLFTGTGADSVLGKVKNGFSNVFSKSGGLMSSIGSSFGGIFNSIGSMISGVFGGSSKTGRVVNAGMAAYQGYQTGGYGGAIAGGVSALFSANGNAFSNNGVIHAFANGGAFTNEIYNSPTMFKFAHGGQFGVMGEAGPEAVMPLQRDSSGRLGVAVNSGSSEAAAAGNTVVSINIEVNNNGSTSSESQSGDSQSDWKVLSDRVKSVVQEEIVKQKRPGGMLR